MRVVLIIILIVMNGPASYADPPSLVLCSSSSGKYVVFSDPTDSKKYLVDIDTKKKITEFNEKMTPLTWTLNNCLIYSTEGADSTEIRLFDLRTETSTTINKVGKEWFKNAVQRSDHLTIPNVVSDSKAAFILYLDHDTMYKYWLATNKNEMVLRLPSVLQSTFINNITVDSHGKTVVFACKDDRLGYIYKIDLPSRKLTLIEKNKDLKNLGSFVYFTKDDDIITYFKYRTEYNSQSATLCLFNLKLRESHSLRTFSNVMLVSVVHIPSHSKFLLNTLDQNTREVLITKNILLDLADGLTKSFGVVEVSY